jgi:hypothetical protein
VQSFDRNVTGIGVLADPVRRQLYHFVCSQAQPVTRGQAAAAVGVARRKAKFHLGRLEAEGLLEADYVRLTGRTGPGAGVPPSATAEFAASSPLVFRRGPTSWLATSWPRQFRSRRAPAHQSSTRSMARRPPTASHRRDGSDADSTSQSALLTEQAYEPRRTAPWSWPTARSTASRSARPIWSVT